MSDNNEVKVKEEGKSKKREWIKNIAIIFLSIMLLLTFFSNTIMNRTLPQVSTQYVSDGVIETQIRGTGKLQAIDPYNLVVQETRTVASVLKKEGDHVEIGDVIYRLEGEESSELVTARAELEDLKLSYQKGILAAGLSRNDVAQIENGTAGNITTTQAAVEGYDSRLEKLNKEVVGLNAQASALQLQLESIQSAGKIDSYNITVEKKKKETEMTALNSKLSGYDKGSAEYSAISAEIDKLTTEIAELQAAIDNNSHLDELNTQAVENKKQELANQIAAIKTNISTKEAEIKNIETDKKLNVDNYTAILDTAALYKKIQTKQDQVDKLEAKALGGEITAPVAGNITSLSYKAGEKINAGDTSAVIRIDGKGYTTSISVTNKQASAVNVGDTVTFEDAWNIGDATANLVSITADKDKPGQNKLLIFEVNGSDVTDGQSVTLSVGEKSSKYQLVVPNSAVREDNNGKFILILESKSTPFGNRYVADRVDVEVLAKDDKNTAISAGLEGYEYVITTSSKPIKNGDQVRMAE